MNGSINSSSDEGEISDQSDDCMQDTVPSKLSNQKLWSNVMIDQAADDIAGVNTFAGHTSNRSIESVDLKRKRCFGDEHPSPMQTSIKLDPLEDSPVQPSKRSRRIYGDVTPEGLSDDATEATTKSILSDDLKQRLGSAADIKNGSELSFEDIIMESSRFIDKALDCSKARPETGVADVTQYICWVLNETNEPLITRAIEMLGVELCYSVLDETLKLEKEGGLLTNDGSRRRLPGGVFISQLKKKTNRRQQLHIFEGFSSEKVEQMMKARNNKKRDKSKALRKREYRNATAKKKEVSNNRDTLEETINLAETLFADEVAEETAQCENANDIPITDECVTLLPDETSLGICNSEGTTESNCSIDMKT